jgi:cell division septation protein DedD
LAAGPAGPPSARIETAVGRPPSTLEAQAAGLARSQQQVAALPANTPPAMHLSGPINSGGTRTDYEIQIGAFGSAAEAERHMDDAKKQTPMLAAHAALALPVQDGTRTLYRARFSGFGSSEAADACSALKRKAFDCMVVRP